MHVEGVEKGGPDLEALERCQAGGRWEGGEVCEEVAQG